MLTKSTDAKVRDTKALHLEKREDQIKTMGEDRQRDAKKILHARHDATNSEQQQSSILAAEAFAKRLGKLVPNLRAWKHPRYTDKVCFGLTLDRKDVLHISSGEFPYMPEWSTFRIEKELFPNISPKKLYSREGVPIEHFTPDIPAQVEREAAVFEVTRGWRTILARFIIKGIVSLELVEKEFGVGDRASWAALLKAASFDKRDLAL